MTSSRTNRILKPWWDVFMDYIGVIMLMLAIFSGTMQLSKDQVACLPILEESTNPEAAQNRLECSTSFLGTAPSTTRDLPDSVAHELLNTQPTPLKGEDRWSQPQPRGRKTNLDYQQYVFCQPNVLPWCPTMVQQILPLPCPHTHHNANGKQQFLVQVSKDQLKDWTLCFHFGAVLWITLDNESFVWNRLWRFWGKAEIHRWCGFPETRILRGQQSVYTFDGNSNGEVSNRKAYCRSS